MKADRYTNEELAERIQNGESELIEQLWKQVRNFVAMQAYKTMRSIPKTAAFDAEDLIQSGYFAVVDAVNRYDADKGTFLNVLSYTLRTAFAVAGEWRTEKQKRQWDNLPISINTPVCNFSDGEEVTLADILADKRDRIAEIEEKLYREAVAEALNKVLEQIPSEYVDIVKDHHLKQKTFQAIADEKNQSRQNTYQKYKRSLYDIRRLIMRLPEAEILREYVEDRTPYHLKVGPDTFNRTHTSSVEQIVFYRDMLEREALREADLSKMPPNLREAVELYRYGKTFE